MTGANSITTDMLQAGDTFIIHGKTCYPKITHVIDGDELKEEIQRATQAGRIAINVPHTTVTLTDAFVECVNPQAPTLAEQYAQGRLYQNKEGKPCYTAVRKNNTLADYGVIDPNDPNKVQGIYLDPNKIVANDLEVRCYFRVFDGKAGMHKGISLDTIVFLEPVKYYEFNSTDSQLRSRGLTWEPPKGQAPEYHPNQQMEMANDNQYQQANEQSASPYQQAQPAYGQQSFPPNPAQAQGPANQGNPYTANAPMPQQNINQQVNQPTQTQTAPPMNNVPNEMMNGQVQQGMPQQNPNMQGQPMTTAPNNMNGAMNAPVQQGMPNMQGQPMQTAPNNMNGAMNAPVQQGQPMQTIGNANPNANPGSAFDDMYQY